MPRKQRFAPKKPRAPKLADGTVPLTPVQRSPTLITALPLAPPPADETATAAPPITPVRGRDAVIDD